MAYEIMRNDEEVDRVLNWAAEGEDKGTHFAGMNYEQGIKNALLWLFGDYEDAPDS